MLGDSVKVSVLWVRDSVFYKLNKVFLRSIIYTNPLLSLFLDIPSYPVKSRDIVCYLRSVSTLYQVIIFSLLQFRLVEEVLSLLDILPLIY